MSHLPPLQDLLDLFPTNSAGEIGADDIRSQTTTLYDGIVFNEDNFDNFLPLSGLVEMDEFYVPSSPQSVATKAIVDAVSTGTGFLQLLGGSMLGELRLEGSNPQTSVTAASKGYVDTEVANSLTNASPAVLRSDGSILMDNGYSPIQDLGIATKKFVEDSIVAPADALLVDGTNSMTGTLKMDEDTGLIWKTLAGETNPITSGVYSFNHDDSSGTGLILGIGNGSGVQPKLRVHEDFLLPCDFPTGASSGVQPDEINELTRKDYVDQAIADAIAAIPAAQKAFGFTVGTDGVISDTHGGQFSSSKIGTGNYLVNAPSGSVILPQVFRGNDTANQTVTCVIEERSATQIEVRTPQTSTGNIQDCGLSVIVVIP